MNAPRRLSAVPASPYYDADAIKQVNKVFIDGVHLPMCVAYDIDAGWAFNKIDGLWQPKQYGKITVEMNP